MLIYLASRYSRRVELCGYREQLQSMGHVVTSRWLNGSHQVSDAGVPIGEDGEALVEGDDDSCVARGAELRAQFAAEDLDDVMRCDALIAFTEQPRSGHSRGGRHVELGIALGAIKTVWIIGPHENIFCWHAAVQRFETFEDLIGELGSAVLPVQ